MFSIPGTSDINITLYENGQGCELKNTNANPTIKIFPDPGKLNQMLKMRQYQVKCQQIQHQQEKCYLKMTKIDDDLEYGEENTVLMQEYQQLSKQSNALKAQINSIKNYVRVNKENLFNNTTCSSKKFLHILITNPQVVCPYKNNPQVEVTKNTILESFMCIQEEKTS